MYWEQNAGSVAFRIYPLPLFWLYVTNYCFMQRLSHCLVMANGIFYKWICFP